MYDMQTLHVSPFDGRIDYDDAWTKIQQQIVFEVGAEDAMDTCLHR